MSDSMLDLPEEAAPAVKAPSFASQVKALLKGQSAAKVRRLAMDSEEAQNLTDYTRQFRQPIDAFVSKERKATLRDLIVEQGTIVTGQGYVLVVVSVTRN